MPVLFLINEVHSRLSRRWSTEVVFHVSIRHPMLGSKHSALHLISWWVWGNSESTSILTLLWCLLNYILQGCPCWASVILPFLSLLLFLVLSQDRVRALSFLFSILIPRPLWPVLIPDHNCFSKNCCIHNTVTDYQAQSIHDHFSGHFKPCNLASFFFSRFSDKWIMLPHNSSRYGRASPWWFVLGIPDMF